MVRKTNGDIRYEPVIGSACTNLVQCKTKWCSPSQLSQQHLYLFSYLKEGGGGGGGGEKQGINISNGIVII